MILLLSILFDWSGEFSGKCSRGGVPQVCSGHAAGIQAVWESVVCVNALIHASVKLLGEWSLSGHPSAGPHPLMWMREVPQWATEIDKQLFLTVTYVMEVIYQNINGKQHAFKLLSL